MSNDRSLLGRCAAEALSWLGEDCPLCGARSGQELLCAACAADLPGLPEHCPLCAVPVPGGSVCGDCLANPPHFDGTTALWLYEFPCDQLVHALKYRAQLALAGFFARTLASRQLPEIDLIVPMPLHPKRLAERGFNQALEIARVFARRLRKPIEPLAVLRVKHTSPQTGLPYEERAKNVHGAFARHRDVYGKRIAVVDDVMTTGATLDELARVLKGAGAARVENLVVARTAPR